VNENLEQLKARQAGVLAERDACTALGDKEGVARCDADLTRVAQEIIDVSRSMGLDVETADDAPAEKRAKAKDGGE
jgi:hypothetical protein